MAGQAAERRWCCKTHCRDRERAHGFWHGNWAAGACRGFADVSVVAAAVLPQSNHDRAKLRMTVVKLDDGTLWLHSPVALTGEVSAALMTLGPVGHIVLGNNFLEHSIFASNYAKAFPGALLYSAVPLEKLHSRVRKGLARVDEVLSDSPPSAWEGQIDQVHFNIDNTLIECIFYHKMSKTLLASDSLLYFDDVDLLSRGSRQLIRLSGLYKQFGSALPMAVRSKKNASKPVVSKILEKLEAWDFDKVVAAHGSAPVRDGKSVLWKSFGMPQPLE
eukprot:SM000072S21233  [mRNA]  locus=s72:439355:441085:- [translate_table: standard]